MRSGRRSLPTPSLSSARARRERALADEKRCGCGERYRRLARRRVSRHRSRVAARSRPYPHVRRQRRAERIPSSSPALFRDPRARGDSAPRAPRAHARRALSTPIQRASGTKRRVPAIGAHARGALGVGEARVRTDGNMSSEAPAQPLPWAGSVRRFLAYTGGLTLLLGDATRYIVSMRFRFTEVIHQAYFLGVESAPIIILTSGFTGMV